ncbi:MAG: D-glycero-beta-D-manno-heptose-7-phosphate kinase [Chlamydiae bacterium]|nr:D-glycero-beta-D-manno-heptose-7-phosphate kinase [Chlamydiota bacterium]
MVKLIGLLSRFNPVRVLVMGDFMLDTYTTGKVKRVSPEAPVSILHVEKEESLAGGAGNVALNLLSLGAKVSVIGRVGHDIAGDELKACLEKEGICTEGLLYQKGFKTPVKNRLIADKQQILRVDFEESTPLPEQVEEEVLQLLPKLLEEVQVIAISDYAKGFLTPKLLQAVIALAKTMKLPVIIDPKGNDFSRYNGATMIKPNLAEAYAAASISPTEPLEKAAEKIFTSCQVDALLITKSEAGISFFHRGGGEQHFPVRSKEVKDVTGAGDTVLAVVSLAFANSFEVRYAAQLANIAAGIAIERSGCARVDLADLAERLLEFDVENKIFDEEHLYALQQVLKGRRYIVLGLDSRMGMTTELFKTLRKLSSKDKEKKLIVYIKDDAPCEDFILMLSSFSEVDFLVLRCESLKSLCDVIHPHQVYTMEIDGKLDLLEHASALLSRLRDLHGVKRTMS